MVPSLSLPKEKILQTVTYGNSIQDFILFVYYRKTIFLDIFFAHFGVVLGWFWVENCEKCQTRFALCVALIKAYRYARPPNHLSEARTKCKFHKSARRPPDVLLARRAPSASAIKCEFHNMKFHLWWKGTWRWLWLSLVWFRLGLGCLRGGLD